MSTGLYTNSPSDSVAVCLQLSACFYGCILSPRQNCLTHVLPYPYSADPLQLLDAIVEGADAAPEAADLMQQGAAASRGQLGAPRIAASASPHVYTRSTAAVPE